MNCQEQDLQNSFMTYPNSSIYSHNRHYYASRTHQECEDMCIALPYCRTFETTDNNGPCKLSNVTVLDKPQHWRAGTETGEHVHQRHCV
nr:hypothetical protein BaRGS_006015 [Batillaria attramentaria]